MMNVDDELDLDRGQTGAVTPVFESEIVLLFIDCEIIVLTFVEF
jgi:hypothetical protein